MAEEEHRKIILLNRIVTRSVSRAPDAHKPPAHAAYDLLSIIDQRRSKNWAVEYLNAQDDEDEEVRAKNGIGHNLIRLRQCKFGERGGFRYATLLFEYIDQSVRSFPVVHTKTFGGREISGDEEERGATASHFIIRMPGREGYDDGCYRCALEVVPPITRREVAGFLSRQVRRGQDWTFSVDIVNSRGKTITKSYKYHPRFDLLADIGRKLSATDGRTLSHMLFTKRDEKQAIGKPTSVIHEDVYADIELKISAKQGPDDQEAQRHWVQALTGYFTKLGYESRLYYRHTNGGLLSGEISQAVDGAADLVMCPKEIVNLKKKPRVWVSRINNEIAEHMMDLVDRDELWEKAR